MTDVISVHLKAGWETAPLSSIDLELRLDTPDGKLAGKGSMALPKKDQKTGTISIPPEAITDGRFHKLYFVYKPKPGSGAVTAAISGIEFNAK